MANICDLPSSALTIDVLLVWALAGPLKHIHTLVLKQLHHCHGCMIWVIFVLKVEPSPQSQVVSTLEQDFFTDLCSWLHLYIPQF